LLRSSAARAHEVNKTQDWVVLFYDGPSGEHQCTVITSEFGQFEGKRIVRGRERECREYYQALNRTALKQNSGSDKSMRQNN
jgi:hypothetical protein